MTEILELCAFCDGNHCSKSCSIVTKPDVRKSILFKDRKCFRCFKSFHTAEKCRSEIKCHLCGGGHHVSICTFTKPKNDEASKQNDSPKDARGKSVFETAGQSQSLTSNEENASRRDDRCQKNQRFQTKGEEYFLSEKSLEKSETLTNGSRLFNYGDSNEKNIARRDRQRWISQKCQTKRDIERETNHEENLMSEKSDLCAFRDRNHNSKACSNLTNLDVRKEIFSKDRKCFICFK